MKHSFEEKSEEYIFYQIAFPKKLMEVEFDKFKQK